MDPNSEALEYVPTQRITSHEYREVIEKRESEELEKLLIPKYPWLTPTIMNAISGTVAGLAGVVAGHPFDTVKVRLQNCQTGPTAYRSTLQTFRVIIKEESVFGLFKGMSSPLAGVALINAFLFGVYGKLLDVQQKWTGIEKGEVTINQVFWAGAGSGFINSLISGPTELAKIQLQVQKNAKFKGKVLNKEELRGPVDCLRRIYQSHGIKGCLRGMGPTILRETPSYGVYFASFEILQRRFLAARPENEEYEEGRLMKSMKLMMAGGLSGIFGWLSTYPVDVVKTRIQAQSIVKKNGEAPYQGTLDCAKRIVKAEGALVLWRGLGATVLRAFPTNAVIFLAYSTTIDLLDRHNYP